RHRTPPSHRSLFVISSMHLRSNFLLACLALLPASLPAATTVVRGPYLQIATPTGLVVRWRTDYAEASLVRFGLARNELTSTAKSEGIVTEHIVQLSGLKPDTKYFYRVGSGLEKPPAANAEDAPGLGPIGSFTTPPPVGPAKPMRVW